MFSTAYRSSFFFILLFALSSVAAQDSYPLRVIGDARDGEIRLRWAPLDDATWERANQAGYRLERVELGTGATTVLAENLRPLRVNEWDNLLDSIPPAAMYYGALYSEDLQITSDTPDDLAEVIRVNRFGLSLLAADQYFEVSLAAGLGFRDPAVQPGTTYRYSVSINGITSNEGDKAAVLNINSDTRTNLPPPDQPTGEWKNHEVTLAWDQSLTTTSYTTYSVVRSEAGKPFEKRNEIPLLFIDTEESNAVDLYFTDTLESNETEYTYRIIGRSPFGVDGNPSETVTGTGVPLPIPFSPRITNMLQTVEDGIMMTWQVEREAEGQYTGFKIYRSLDGLENWELITPNTLPKERRTYTDTNPKSGWFYRVKLIDKNNYEVGGMPRLLVLEDKYPPAPPTGLTGKMDTNGIVRLSWTPNTEDDHQGYRVFISNQLEGVYTQDTYDAIIDTTYRDTVTMNTLSEKVYYKLKAIDYYGNYSGFSEAGTVDRPDLNPPAPPNIDKLVSSVEGVTIGWTDSPSEDVVSYALERRPIGATIGEWAQVYSETGDAHSYEDRDMQLGRRYEYRIVVTDDVGLQGTSVPAIGSRIDDGKRATITELAATAQSDRVILTFSCLYPVDPEYFQIYRSLNDGPLVTFRTLPVTSKQLYRTGKQAFRFSDLEVKPGSTVTYQVLARYSDGGFTPLSEQVSAKVE